MKQVILYFPDIVSLTEFVLTEQIAGVQTRSVDFSLRGGLSKEQIEVACTHYDAHYSHQFSFDNED